MDKHRRSSATASALLVIICLLFIFVLSYGDEGPERLEKKTEEKPSMSEFVRSLFTVSTSAPTSGSYFDKVKTLINRAQTYIFPPNLDFRGGDKAVDHDQGKGSGGEKGIKEAAAKSIEKSKETVEDSAKSAAEIAGKTMQKTKEKVKKSFSNVDQSEL